MHVEPDNSTRSLQPAKQLDVRGYNCPIPLLRTKKALASMQPGEILEVMTTDPGAEIDFRVFAEATGNAILALEQSSGVLTLLIEKSRQTRRNYNSQRPASLTGLTTRD